MKLNWKNGVTLNKINWISFEQTSIEFHWFCFKFKKRTCSIEFMFEHTNQWDSIETINGIPLNKCNLNVFSKIKASMAFNQKAMEFHWKNQWNSVET